MLFLSLLALGFVHGMGADHLMAIAALSVTTPAVGGSRYRRTFGLAVRFAAGHALFLTLGTAAVLLLGWQLPSWVEEAGEAIGGWLLIVLGIAGGWLAATGRIYAHSHPHVHAGESHDHPHSHWHFHIGRRHTHRARSIHDALPGILGAVFAISGLRALVLSLQVSVPSLDATLALGRLIPQAAVFGAGIVVSMSVFGMVLARTLDARRMQGRLASAAAAVTAIGSIALGIYWIH